jgi:hypothetical protein
VWSVLQEVTPNPVPRDTAKARLIRPNFLNFMRFLHPRRYRGLGLPLQLKLY